MESTFVDTSLLAGRMMMCFDVDVAWRDLTTIHAVKLCNIFFGPTGTVKPTYPLLQRQMEGLFVALPVILGLENFRTKSALI
jgi:hypothetical protein